MPLLSHTYTAGQRREDASTPTPTPPPINGLSPSSPSTPSQPQPQPERQQLHSMQQKSTTGPSTIHREISKAAAAAHQVPPTPRRELMPLETATPEQLRAELTSKRRLCAALELQLKATAGHVVTLQSEINSVRVRSSAEATLNDSSSTLACPTNAADAHAVAASTELSDDRYHKYDAAWESAGPGANGHVSPEDVARVLKKSGLEDHVL